MNKPERLLMIVCGFVAMVTPTGSLYWMSAMAAACVYLAYHIITSRLAAKGRLAESVV